MRKCPVKLYQEAEIANGQASSKVPVLKKGSVTGEKNSHQWHKYPFNKCCGDEVQGQV